MGADDSMTPITFDSRFRIGADVHYRRFGSEVVVLDLAAGEYFALDEVGTVVWQALLEGRSVSEIVTQLASDYEVALAELRADLLALAEDLVKKKLLVAVPSSR